MAGYPTDHLKLGNPPLKQVICQLRFPPVLGFGAPMVRPFQRAIEDDYPNVEVGKTIVGVNVVGAGASPSNVDFKDTFQFRAADGHTGVVVAEDFLSLETSAYSRFHDFLDRWLHVLQAALDALELRRQARLGLRFTNIVEREGIDTLEGWAGLIEEHLLAGVRQTASLLSGATFVAQSAARMTTAHGVVAFRHGFPSLPLPGEALPVGYLLDIDNYDEQPALIDVRRHREQLNAWDHQSYALLRGSVTQMLWDSFEPEGPE